MGIMTTIRKVLVGEQDPLKVGSRWGLGNYGFKTTLQAYKMDLDQVDYKLTKALYWNNDDRYNLGAGFAKPIIDTVAGFTGVPEWAIDDAAGQFLLDQLREQFLGELEKVNTKTFRDGDCYIRIYRTENAGLNILTKDDAPNFKIVVLPAGTASEILDPANGNPIGYQVVTAIEHPDQKKAYTMVERITADKIETYYEGKDIPVELRGFTKRNPKVDMNIWGVVPIVHWSNEREEDELYGRSDLSAVFPLMVAYHNIATQALKNNRLHSSPKLKLRIEDVASFMASNFGIDINTLGAGKQPQVNMDNQDMVILSSETDDMVYVQAQDTSTGSQTLMGLIFWCIVQTSGVPEFAFGTAMQSSKASVREQMTPLVKKIAHKRNMMSDGYKRLASVLLHMHEMVGFGAVNFSTYHTELRWDEVSDKNSLEEAQALSSEVSALTNAVTNGILSVETAINRLRKLMPEIGSSADELKLIEAGKEFLDRVNTGGMLMQDEAIASTSDPEEE